MKKWRNQRHLRVRGIPGGIKSPRLPRIDHVHVQGVKVPDVAGRYGRSWVFAVPAISASPKSSVRPDRCACARNRAAHSVPTLSKGRIRSSYSAMIPSRPSCRLARRCPCAMRCNPYSNSWITIDDSHRSSCAVRNVTTRACGVLRRPLRPRSYPGDSRSCVFFIDERDLPIRTAARDFKLYPTRHVLDQPLPQRFTWRRLFLPQSFGHDDEGVSPADMLRPLLFGETQDFGQSRLGLGNGPSPVEFGMLRRSYALLSIHNSPI